MTQQRTIEITVNAQGQTRIETKGFNGSSCQQASRALEQALGLRLNEQLTPEFYQTQEPNQQRTSES